MKKRKCKCLGEEEKEERFWVKKEGETIKN